MPGEKLPLDGAFNFRDIGGYRTREGRTVVGRKVYRADALHRLGPADYPTLEPLGIDTIFDLRTATELESDGVGEFVAGRNHVHVPLIEVSLNPINPAEDWLKVDLRDRYIEMLNARARAVPALFEWIAKPTGTACIFHCTGGKDRTGVVAALLLRTLGVDDEDVIADYALSQDNLVHLMDGYRDELIARGIDDDAIRYLTSSPPERMRYTLSELDGTWGSTEGYLEDLGIRAETVEAVRDNLLE